MKKILVCASLVAVSVLVACSDDGKPPSENATHGTATGGTGGSTTSEETTSSSTTSAAGAAGAPGGASDGQSTSDSAGGATSTSSGSSSGGAAGAAGDAGDSEVVFAGEMFSVDHELASDSDANAPGTVGIVTWSIADVTVDEANIEFGLDTSYGMVAPVDLNEVDFRTLLLGMKPDRSYHFRIAVSSDAITYVSDDYVIETGPATDIVEVGPFMIHDEARRERGFIVGSYWQGDYESVAFILDADGEIVWWYDNSSNGIARARMSEDGKNMWMVVPSNSAGPVSRVSMDTLEGQVYAETAGSHDLTPVTGATIAYVDYGESDCDSIFEIDPVGIPVEVFESEGEVMAQTPSGACHGNALRYSRAEDVYTFSDLYQDVLIVNRQGGVDWRLSELIPGGIQTLGGRQHGHHLLDDSILVFANLWDGQQNSMVVEYDFEGQEIWRYEGGGYTQQLGDVQRLPGGNTLVTYSNEPMVHEVDPGGNVVLEFYGSGSSFGYLNWRETLYGPPSDVDL